MAIDTSVILRRDTALNLWAPTVLADAVGSLHNDGAGNLTWGASGGGITGPVSSTITALVRWDDALGTAVRDSNVTLADSGTALVFSGAGGVSAGGSNQNVTLTPSGTGKSVLASSVQLSAYALGILSTDASGNVTALGVGTNLSISGGNLNATSGGGDFIGPSSSTDHAIVRFDGTTGKLGEDSLVTIADSGSLVSPELTTDASLWAGNLGIQGYSASNNWIGFNTYFDGSNSKYKSTSFAGQISYSSGVFYLSSAPSGSAGGNITFNNLMVLDRTADITLTPSIAGSVIVTNAKTGGNVLFQAFGSAADYTLVNFGKDSTHYITGQWDALLNRGGFSTYNNAFPFDISGSDIQFNTNFLERAVISNAGALRLNTYGDGMLRSDSSGNITSNSYILTGNPSGGTAAQAKIGSVTSIVSAVLSLNYLQIDIAGTAYKVALLT